MDGSCGGAHLKRLGEVDINDADVAQLGEHETEDLRVAGSIPAISTFLYLPHRFTVFKNKTLSAVFKKISPCVIRTHVKRVKASCTNQLY